MNLAKSKTEYQRDGRAPIPANEVTSKLMRANKAAHTKPELILRKALWSHGIRGYRLHWKKVAGRPDIAFPGKKIAIFVNGCYWHRCPKCNLPLPKSNSEFWLEKFNKNVQRDSRKIHLLINSGWKVITIWECELKESIFDSVQRIKLMVKNEN